jgi:hypothetical protein
MFDDQITCGMHVASEFQKDPSRPVDRSCVDTTPRIDFRGVPEVVRRISGQDSAWAPPAP